MSSNTNPLENPPRGEHARPTALRIGASSGSRISWGDETAFVPDTDVGDEKPCSLATGAINFKPVAKKSRAEKAALKKEWAALKRGEGLEEPGHEIIRKYWMTIDEQLKEATAKWDKFGADRAKAEETKTVKVEAETKTSMILTELEKMGASGIIAPWVVEVANLQGEMEEPTPATAPTPTPSSASSSADRPKKAPKALLPPGSAGNPWGLQ